MEFNSLTIDDTFESLNPENYIFYQGFLTKEAADDYKKMLDEYQINNILEETKNVGERVIIGDLNRLPYILKVLKTDFYKIPEAIKFSLEKLPQTYFESHPLNILNSNELMKIVDNFNDEAYEEFYTAIKLLSLRGLDISAEKIELVMNKKSSNDIIGKKISLMKLLLILFIMIMGIFMSWIVIIICILIFCEYIFGKRNDKVGKRIFTYDVRTRSISKTFVLVGLLINLLSILYFINYKPEMLIGLFNTPFLSF